MGGPEPTSPEHFRGSGAERTGGKFWFERPEVAAENFARDDAAESETDSPDSD